MAKSPRKSASKQQPAAVPVKTIHFEVPEFFKNTLLQSLLLFAFAFLLYANTLRHGFVQDDAIVITDNMFTTKGAEGISGILGKDTFFGFFKVEGKENLVSGGRYRPLTLVLFALLYEVAGNNPFPFHLLTVLLFAATCVLLYRTLLVLLQGRQHWREQAPIVAWVAALLFAAHPIHTEVVANIKGCDEIVTLLGSIGALWLTLRYADTGKLLWAVLAGAAFFLACLSKENAATFVVVIPMALWFFRPATWGQAARYSVPVWIGFLVFFILRGSILQWKFGAAPMELMNNPFLKIEGTRWVAFTAGEKFATILYTLGKYLVLLVFPHPLTHDYYPRYIDLKTFSDPGVLLSLAGYGFFIWYALRGLGRRDPIAFSILFFLLTISIVSNLVFPIGTNMGERFAFMPSVGFCLAVGALLVRPGNWKIAVGLAGVAALLFSVKTVQRNPVWDSNENLFFTDVKTSANSAKINNACGGVLFEKAQNEKDETKRQELLRRSFDYASKALKIYPNYKDAYITRAGCQYFLKNYDAAVADYLMATQIAPEDERAIKYLAIAQREAGKYYGEQKGDLVTAHEYLFRSWGNNNKDPETARLTGVAYGVQGDHGLALEWFLRAADLAPDNAGYQYDVGTAYYILGNTDLGGIFHRRAIRMNPNIEKEKKR